MGAEAASELSDEARGRPLTIRRSAYVLGLRATACATRDLLANEQAQASRKEDVLSTLSQMATRFRTRVGESLATIERYSTPLQATTPSLEALPAYSAGFRATYGVGPKKMSDGYAYIMPMRGYINLGFYQGAVLEDPERLLQGTGKGLRHVKVRSLAEANRPPVRALVAVALARRRNGASGPDRASSPRRSR